ncbi:MAG: class A beta-lactamase-related serine hydrolase [Firmicutes bacterium]|nr:class A beta-lactamase-related serine hydrolase [Bacillota bacterium]
MEIKERIQEIAGRVQWTFGLAVKHLESGEEIHLGAEEAFPAASVIKVPIMAEVFRQAEEGKFRLDQRIKLTAEDQVGGSGILQTLTPGIELPVLDLVTLMIIVSDNTATNMLLDLVGIENVNSYMTALGLKNTVVYNKLMVIPAERRGNNTVTPWDMTHLLELMTKGKVVSYRSGQRMIGIMKKQQYNDLIPALFPPANGGIGSLPRWQVAHKTGFIPGTRNDVGIVFLPGQAYAISILSKDLKEERQGIQAIAEISRTIYDHFTGGAEKSEGGH